MSKLGNLKIVEYKPEHKQIAQNAGQALAAACYEIHSAVGGGLEADVYKTFLIEELKRSGKKIDADVPFAVSFKDTAVDIAFTADIVIDDSVIVLVKAEPKTEEHKTLIATYLKHAKMGEGFLVNFNVADMRHGIMRAAVQTGKVPLIVQKTKTAGAMN